MMAIAPTAFSFDANFEVDECPVDHVANDTEIDSRVDSVLFLIRIFIETA